MRPTIQHERVQATTSRTSNLTKADTQPQMFARPARGEHAESARWRSSPTARSGRSRCFQPPQLSGASARPTSTSAAGLGPSSVTSFADWPDQPTKRAGARTTQGRSGRSRPCRRAGPFDPPRLAPLPRCRPAAGQVRQAVSCCEGARRWPIGLASQPAHRGPSPRSPTNGRPAVPSSAGLLLGLPVRAHAKGFRASRAAECRGDRVPARSAGLPRRPGSRTDERGHARKHGRRHFDDRKQEPYGQAPPRVVLCLQRCRETAACLLLHSAASRLSARALAQPRSGNGRPQLDVNSTRPWHRGQFRARAGRPGRARWWTAH